jgi:aryl-alcohol dehydrogenase-like predicted oxidoreductase
VRAVAPIATVQNEYSRGYTVSDDVLAVCESEGIGFMPWRPLGDFRDDPVRELRWLLARSPAMLPIPGTSSVEHLETNMRAAA